MPFCVLKEINDFRAICTYRDENRLMAYHIPQHYLARVNYESVKVALESLHSRAIEKIREIRQNKDNDDQRQQYRNGQHHALWTQLYANSTLALQEISTETINKNKE